MKRLLVVAYYFPPDGGAGTQRAAKFCKYLPEFGWQTAVVTRGTGGQGGEWTPPDPTLNADIPGVTEILRVAVPAEYSGIALKRPRVDRHQMWIGAAYTAILEWVGKRPVDAVFVTMSPFSLAHLGNALASALQVPVVFDLRDPWALDGWPTYATWWHWLRDRRFMHRTLVGASGIIANTTEANRALLSDIRGLEPHRVVTIPNGFDAEDFGATHRHVPSDRFVIAHVGSLHSYVLYPSPRPVDRLKRLVKYRPEPIRPEGRTLLFLLRAIERLRIERHPAGSKALIILAGETDEATEKTIRDAGMESFVQILGYRPHKEAVQWLQRADALFLPLHGLPPGRRARIVPGKTYEYLASGRPILGCVPEGDARDLIEKSGGACADPCDDAEIAVALRRLYELAHMPPSPPPEWLQMYERRTLSGRLATFLDHIIAVGPSRRSSQAPERAVP